MSTNESIPNSNPENKAKNFDNPKQTVRVEDFTVHGDYLAEIKKCSSLKEFSDLLTEIDTLVDNENYLSEEEMKKISDLCRFAQFALTKESIEEFLGRQDEVPEYFGLREKYVELVKEKFNMHPTLH